MQAQKLSRVNDELRSYATGSQVDSSPLVGAWINTDKATGGIAKLILSKKGDSFFVQAFGACAPSPRDWGKVEGEVYSLGAGLREGAAFKARYDFGFMETFLAAYLNKRILVVDSYNTFKDGSGRSKYFQRDHFHQ
ncbi:MAG: hypothetical protein AB1631_15855 [Acidobacteriota bacterium]